MNIRAHHLLCMKYFKGKGYSKEFVSNFYDVIKKLKKNPIIKIVNHPGVICNSCPHNADNKCVKKGPDFENKVKKKDNKVMKYLGIKSNEEMRISDARKLVDDKLASVKKLCKECEWLEYCI